MARFRFDLQRLLDHRQRVERDKQLAVAALERERIALEDRIREHQRAIGATKADLRSALLGERLRERPGARASGGMDPRSVRMQAGASLHLVVKTQQLVIALAGLHKKINAARLELLQAATQRKAVELLRQRRFERWRMEQARRETAELDDLTAARVGRSDALDAGGDLPSGGTEESA